MSKDVSKMWLGGLGKEKALLRNHYCISQCLKSQHKCLEFEFSRQNSQFSTEHTGRPEFGLFLTQVMPSVGPSINSPLK